MIRYGSSSTCSEYFVIFSVQRDAALARTVGGRQLVLTQHVVPTKAVVEGQEQLCQRQVE